MIFILFVICTQGQSAPHVGVVCPASGESVARQRPVDRGRDDDGGGGIGAGVTTAPPDGRPVSPTLSTGTVVLSGHGATKPHFSQHPPTDCNRTATGVCVCVRACA